MKIGLWKTKNATVYTSHMAGLKEDQVTMLKNLKAGDRLVLFVNDVREGETGPNYTLARSTLEATKDAA